MDSHRKSSIFDGFSLKIVQFRWKFNENRRFRLVEPLGSLVGELALAPGVTALASHRNIGPTKKSCKRVLSDYFRRAVVGICDWKLPGIVRAR